MLEKITLTNMFNHTKSEITLSKFTVITGLNDSGKSSILHALRWFITDRPKGGKFISEIDGTLATKCSCTVVKDGVSVTKSRTSSGKTQYDDEFTGEVYHKADMPEEIRDIIEIEPFYTFGNVKLELNFSFQLDAPFLLSESASVGALVLGKLSNVSAVDEAAKEFSLDAYRTKTEIQYLESSNEKLRAKLGDKEFSNLEDRIAKNRNMQALYSEIEKNSFRLEQMRKLNTRKLVLDVQILGYNKLINKYDIEAIKNCLSILIADCQRLEKLYQLNLTHYTNTERQKESKKKISSADYILQNVGNSVDVLKLAFKEVTAFISLNEKLNKCREDSLHYANLFDSNKKKIDYSSKLLNSLNGWLSLERTHIKYLQCKVNEEMLTSKIKKCSNVEKIKVVIDELTNNTTKFSALTRNYEQYCRVSKDMEQTENKLQNISVKLKISDDINSLTSVYEKVKNFDAICVSYNKAKDSVDKLEKEFDRKKSNEVDAKNQLELFWKDLDVCPWCSSTITKGE